MHEEIELSEELVATTMTSMSRLLNLGENSDAMTLYMFYLYTSKYQDQKSVKATDTFCMRGLHWGKDRFYRAKKLLQEDGWIEEDIKRDKTNRITAHYVKVKYRVKSHSPHFQRVAPPEGGNQETNTPLVNKIHHKEENTPITVATAEPTQEKAPFNEEEEYDRYKDRGLSENLVVSYMRKYKGMHFPNRDAFFATVPRHLKVAKQITSLYNRETIILAIEKCIKNYEDKWTLETVLRECPTVYKK